jgi:hypothetical protein
MRNKPLLLKEELSRIFELMDIGFNPNILLESGGGGTTIAKSLMPGEGKTIDNLVTTLAKSENDLLTYSAKLASMAPSGTFDEIAQKIASDLNKKSVSDLTDAEIKSWIKGQDGLMAELEVAASKIAKEAVDKQIISLNAKTIFDDLAVKLNSPYLKNVPESIKNVVGFSVNSGNVETIKKFITDLNKILDDLPDSTLKKEFKDQLLGKKVQIENYENFKLVTPPTKPINDPTITPTKVDDVVQTQTTTPIYQKVEAGNIFNEKGNLLDGQTLDQNSFVGEKPDFDKLGINFGSMTPEQKFQYFNVWIISAISKVERNDVGAWDSFPIGGFEKFGIDNFREYVKKYHIDMKSESRPDSWSISFRKSSLDPASAVITKEVTTSGINAEKIKITPEDFIKGSDATGSFTGAKIVEEMSEREIVALLDETLTERINWIKSDVYKQRRMALTGESEAEVDAAVKNIEEYMKNDIIYVFNKTQSDASSSEMEWGGLYNADTGNEYAAYYGKDVPKNYKRFVRVKPKTTKSAFKGTLDHEIDHAMSVILDGSISKEGYENVAAKLEKMLLEVDDEVALTWEGKDGFLAQFIGTFTGKNTPSESTKKYLKYLEKNVEQQVRLNRIYLWMKKNYNLPIDGKLTNEQVDDLYRKWSSGKFKQDPSFNSDMNSYLSLFASKYKKNILSGGEKYNEAIGYLKQLLNVTFGIGGIMSVLNIGIGDSEQTN